jgi:hypothetical protein
MVHEGHRDTDVRQQRGINSRAVSPRIGRSSPEGRREVDIAAQGIAQRVEMAADDRANALR